MNVALYARVSTDDKGQDPLNQLRQLREFARKQQGWTVTREFLDRASGRNGDRQQFMKMMHAAGHHRFDLLLFWSLDRLTREGAFQTLFYLRQLTAAGVKYKSYTEQYIDSLGPFADGIIGIIGALAQAESRRLTERTVAGMARAMAAGIHCGRPAVVLSARRLERLRKLRASGMSISAIGKRMSLSRSMVFDRLTRQR